MFLDKLVKPVTLTLCLVLGLSACQDDQVQVETPNKTSVADDQHQNTPKTKHLCHNDLIAQSFQNQKSDVQVAGCGRVKALLKDDNQGSRHQKFIVSLDGASQTVLIAHNIDLADRIDTLSKGDWVDFYGEYEYSDKGGVVHWTHHDPAGRHQGGYIDHDGRRYQ